MNDTIVIGALVAVITSVCTMVPLLLTQYLRHKEAMRKLDIQEEERQERAAVLLAKISEVEKNTNGMHTQAVTLAYGAGRHDERMGTKTDLGTLN